MKLLIVSLVTFDAGGHKALAVPAGSSVDDAAMAEPCWQVLFHKPLLGHSDSFLQV